MNNNVVNYAQEVIHKTYEENGSLYSFSIYPNLAVEDEGLEETGSKIVTGITSHGTFSFEITKGKGGWVSDNTFYNKLSLMVHVNAALLTGQNVSQN